VNLPNLISLVRLLSVPVLVWLILDGELHAAFWLFVAAGVSDAVDGFVAKRFDARTSLGRYIDPLADKVLLVSVYITLGSLGHLPAWLVILVVFRDMLIIGGTLLFRIFTDQTIALEPLKISKVNTAMQIALVAVVLARLGLSFGDGGLSDGLVYVVAATTFVSGAAYIVRWTRGTAHAEEL
jgi:cardiolipin synthase